MGYSTTEFHKAIYCKQLQMMTKVRTILFCLCTILSTCSAQRAYYGCPEGRFQCANSVCIYGLLICDGDDDCGDLSDETNCSEKECPEGRIKCENNIRCISPEWICDGENDCGDSSDETNCSEKECPKDKFKCENFKCISGNCVCDGEMI